MLIFHSASCFVSKNKSVNFRLTFLLYTFLRLKRRKLRSETIDITDDNLKYSQDSKLQIAPSSICL